MGRPKPVENVFAPGGGGGFPPQGPPEPPRSSSGAGHLDPPPTVRGRPGTQAGCGPAASCRAGRILWTGGPSGGVRPGTAGSPSRWVRPPRGARTVAWYRTTCQTGGQRRSHGAATTGCLVVTAGRRGSPPWSGPQPWGPPLVARPPQDSQHNGRSESRHQISKNEFPPLGIRLRLAFPLNRHHPCLIYTRKKKQELPKQGSYMT